MVVVGAGLVVAGVALYTVDNFDLTPPPNLQPAASVLDSGLTPAQWAEAETVAAAHDLDRAGARRIVDLTYTRWETENREAANYCGMSYYYGDTTGDVVRMRPGPDGVTDAEQAVWAVTINSLITNNC